MSVFDSIVNVIKKKGACYVTLIDPDNKNDDLIAPKLKWLIVQM